MNETRMVSQFESIEALRDEFQRVAYRDAETGRWRRRTSGGRRLGLSLGALALAAAIALTPPGQALAERFGELIGIVDEDGGIVVGAGQSPGEAHPYQVVLAGEPTPGETCIFLRFDEVDGSGMGSCLGEENLADLDRDGLAPFLYVEPSGLLPSESLVLQGLVTSEVVEVGVSYRDGAGDTVRLATDLTPITVPLLEKANVSDEQSGFFVSFLPPEASRALRVGDGEAHLPGVRITGYNDEGEVIAERELGILRSEEVRVPGMAHGLTFTPSD